MKIALINPALISVKNDILGSGIPYMPVSLAYLAGKLRSRHDVTVIDAFGLAPLKKTVRSTIMLQGLTTGEVLARIGADVKTVVLYANNPVAHEYLCELIRIVRREREGDIVVCENTQAVTGYSLAPVAREFLDAGASVVVTGEAEIRIDDVLRCLKKHDFKAVDGALWLDGTKLMRAGKSDRMADVDKLPLPAWELFPLENYWHLGIAHGPLSSERYLPLLTSRGCPFGCRFCVVPSTNSRRWRPRSPKNVVDEMAHWYTALGVREFHLEDLNPTVQKERMVRIAKEVIDRGLPIKWKICAGTKIETVDENTIRWMAKGGCTYISFSPETGSPGLLKKIDKPFDHEKALRLSRVASRAGIALQACFVLGFPGETADDIRMTDEYAMRLAKAGVDEIALFVVTPIPGTETYGQITGFNSISQLTFSPSWRSDYAALQSHRKRLYAKFNATKFLYHPIRAMMQPFNIIRRRFRTKTEMAAYRYYRIHLRG